MRLRAIGEEELALIQAAWNVESRRIAARYN